LAVAQAMEPTPEMTPESQSEPTPKEAPTPAANETSTAFTGAAATPPPAPAPAQSPEPQPAVAESPIASTVSVPADPGANETEGGEWHLLVEKLNKWLADAKLMELWQQSQRPLKLLAGALGLLLLLQLTGAVLGTLDAIPMLPRLLQLTGLIYLCLFASRRLVRSDERRNLIEGVKGSWNAFAGK
jgi:hypothetical protein